MKNGWTNDLIRGQKIEEKIKNEMSYAYCTASKCDDSTHGDFWILHKKQPYILEIKNESRFANSPNICIETHTKKKLSGIWKSGAHIFVHYFSDEKIVCYNKMKMLQILKFMDSTKNKKWFVDWVFDTNFDNSDGASGMLIDYINFKKNVSDNTGGWLWIKTLEEMKDFDSVLEWRG